MTALSSRRRVLKKATSERAAKGLSMSIIVNFFAFSWFVGVEDYCTAFDTRWRQRVNALTVLASGQTLPRAMLASGTENSRRISSHTVIRIGLRKKTRRISHREDEE